MEVVCTIGGFLGALAIGAQVAEWHLRRLDRDAVAKKQDDLETQRLSWSGELKALLDVNNALAAKVAEHDDKICGLMLIDRGGFKK